jgi:hypothetical protein
VNKLVVLAAALLGSVACSKSSSSREAPALAASASATGQHPTAPMADNPRDINALFRVEADNRPTGTLRAEDVLDDFRRAGLELHEQRQHLGRPYGARYCVGAKSGRELALSVCEYVDATAAGAGAEASRKIALANREIRLNRATSLTVRQIHKSPASDALSARFFEAFAKL